MKAPRPGEAFSFQAPGSRLVTYVTISEQGSMYRLPDGRIRLACPQSDEEYTARARALGYADALSMCQEHDLLHARLAACLGLPVSPALVAAANGTPSTELTGAEEEMVLAAARFLNLARKARQGRT